MINWTCLLQKSVQNIIQSLTNNLHVRYYFRDCLSCSLNIGRIHYNGLHLSFAFGRVYIQYTDDEMHKHAARFVHLAQARMQVVIAETEICL